MILYHKLVTYSGLIGTFGALAMAFACSQPHELEQKAAPPKRPAVSITTVPLPEAYRTDAGEAKGETHSYDVSPEIDYAALVAVGWHQLTLLPAVRSHETGAAKFSLDSRVCEEQIQASITKTRDVLKDFPEDYDILLRSIDLTEALLQERCMNPVGEAFTAFRKELYGACIDYEATLVEAALQNMDIPIAGAALANVKICAIKGNLQIQDLVKELDAQFDSLSEVCDSLDDIEDYIIDDLEDEPLTIF
ncbi:hypothetical protein HYS48_02530 [Candidatus Woesearchaeota archaeon]|nr:hypothetical protein [Candidatus Woesearchaeota archaeon]